MEMKSCRECIFYIEKFDGRGFCNRQGYYPDSSEEAIYCKSYMK